MNHTTDETFITRIESLSYEETFTELENVVALLEGGELPLDQSLTLYEQGKHLAKHCQELLEQAEMRVTQLAEEMQLLDEVNHSGSPQ